MVKLYLLNEVQCRLQGLNSDVIDYFYDKFRFLVPNARFQPKVELGIWDGYISYFKKDGNTYINFLPDIIKDLVYIGVKFEIIDNRLKRNLTFQQADNDRFAKYIHPEHGVPIILRYYQADLANALLKKQGGVALLGTGGGKTIIAAVLCDIHNKENLRCLVITPGNLIKQTKFFLNHLNVDMGEFTGDMKDIDHKNVIATWEALQNTPIILRDFDVVLVDECHTCKSNVLNGLLSNQGNKIKYRYGLTATMPKEDHEILAIQSVLGEIVYVKKTSELQAEGFLATSEITIKQLKVNLQSQYEQYKKEVPDTKLSYARYKSSYFPDYASEKSYLRTEKQRVDWIVDYLISQQIFGNVFCLVDSKPFGKKITDLILEKIDKDRIFFVSGNDKMKERQKIYDLFAQHDDIIVVATVHCAGVGTDISRINSFVMIDLGKSFIRIIQAIGRSLRKAHDKTHVYITDVCSDLKYSRRHLNERIKYFKEEEQEYIKEEIDFK